MSNGWSYATDALKPQQPAKPQFPKRRIPRTSTVAATARVGTEFLERERALSLERLPALRAAANQRVSHGR